MQALINLIFIAGVVSISCNPQSKSVSLNNSQTTEVNQVLPKVNFEVKVITEAKKQVNEVEDAGKSEVSILVDGIKIDTYISFGLGEIEESGVFFYFPTIGSKSDIISSEIISENTIIITKTNNISGIGEQYDEWTRTYTKSNGLWKMSKCEGECK